MVYSDMRVGYAVAVSLGENLRTLRRAADLTQVDVGKALCVGQEAVSRWENDQTQPDAVMLPSLSFTIGAALDKLLEGLDPRYDAARDPASRDALIKPKPARDIHAPISEHARVIAERIDRLGKDGIAAVDQILGAVEELLHPVPRSSARRKPNV